MANLDITATLVGKWALDRNLIEGSTVEKQYIKLGEECGELAAGIARGNHEKIVDSIGDAFVVLTIMALQAGTTISECADVAYQEIKDRRGRMVDGIFVKETDE